MDSLEAMGILTNFGTFMFTLPLGLNIAGSLLVGNSLGDNNPKQAVQIAKTSMLLSLMGSVTIAVTLYFLKDVIPIMFTSISSVKLEFSSTFLWYAVNFVPDMWQSALGGILKGLGYQGKAAWVQVFISWLVFIPFSYHFGVKGKWAGGLWLGCFVGNSCLSVVYGFIVLMTNWEERAEEVHQQMKAENQGKPE